MKNLRDEIIEQCVPGGDICDPQEVADSIRKFFKTRCWHCGGSLLPILEDMPAPIRDEFENAHLCSICLTFKNHDNPPFDPDKVRFPVNGGDDPLTESF